MILQAATAYQFRIPESAEIETVALDCQDTPCSVIKFCQAARHAETLPAAGSHITESSVETHLPLKTIARKPFLCTQQTIPPPCTAPN